MTDLFPWEQVWLIILLLWGVVNFAIVLDYINMRFTFRYSKIYLPIYHHIQLWVWVFLVVLFYYHLFY